MINDSRIAIKEFTDLRVWQVAHQLVIEIYKTTKSFPKDEQFGLTSQMRRSSASITANIAEGFGRHSYKEKVQFYYLSHGSLTELKDQLLIAKDVGYLAIKEFNNITNLLVDTQQLLQGLIKKSKTYLDS